MDQRAYESVTDDRRHAQASPCSAIPQYGLAKLLGRIGVTRGDVEEVGAQILVLRPRARPSSAKHCGRPRRPTAGPRSAATPTTPRRIADAALAGVTLVEAPRERDEAACGGDRAEARRSPNGGGIARRWSPATASLRAASRRSCCRFGVQADDSGGVPLANTPAGSPSAYLMLAAAFRPGDPVAVRVAAEAPLAVASACRAFSRAACCRDHRARGAARWRRPA
jgi:ATP-dependent helicase/nuclease subunit B